MLKKYVAPDRLQLVGKAWEIRCALRREQKLRGGRTPLASLLAGGRASPCRN
ncbi:Z-ring formation inhibitor MciZ [Cohnella hongkongensis]|uniref:Z-ring formation inhibitor MciZ n=1 Tax=Cohnella hongkongensis TaxID=178337 RepID=A0ABV9FGF1_9BACL